VIQYDLDRQFRLAASFERSSLGARGRDMLQGLDSFMAYGARLRTLIVNNVALVIVLLILGVAAWFTLPLLLRYMRERRQRERLSNGNAAALDAAILYRRLLALLEKHRITKPPHYTPLEFATRLNRPDVAPQIAEFTHAYHLLRYGRDAQAAARMLSLYDNIQAALHHHSATEPSS
jgi:hypothetical protein